MFRNRQVIGSVWVYQTDPRIKTSIRGSVICVVGQFCEVVLTGTWNWDSAQYEVCQISKSIRELPWTKLVVNFELLQPELNHSVFGTDRVYGTDFAGVIISWHKLATERGAGIAFQYGEKKQLAIFDKGIPSRWQQCLSPAMNLSPLSLTP